VFDDIIIPNMSNARLERPAVVVFNPEGGSYSQEAFDEFLAPLQRALPDVVPLETYPDREKTAIALSEAVNDVEGHAESDEGGAHIVIFGGDGTVHQVILGVAERRMKNAVIAGKEGGTKCNTGRAFIPHVSTLGALKHGVAMDVPLLRTDWVTPNGEKHAVHSVDDVAFGAPVTALERVVARKPITRKLGNLAARRDEVVTTLSAIVRHESFTAKFADGIVQELASLAVSNIHWIAGDGRMRVPANGPYTKLMTAGSEGMIMTGARLSALALGIYSGERQYSGTTFKVETRDQTPLMMELDGELCEDDRRLSVEHGSEVTIEKDWENSFRTFSTSLPMIYQVLRQRWVMQNNLLTKL
jgi:hypothetical protein